MEDRIRAAKDIGLRNLPFHDINQNRIWVAIAALAQDLLAWCARLALPATVSTVRPEGSQTVLITPRGDQDGALIAARRDHHDPGLPEADRIPDPMGRPAKVHRAKPPC